PLVEGAEPFGDDGALVDKHVRAPLTGNEAEALRIVEPLHGARFRHTELLTVLLVKWLRPLAERRQGVILSSQDLWGNRFFGCLGRRRPMGDLQATLPRDRRSSLMFAQVCTERKNGTRLRGQIAGRLGAIQPLGILGGGDVSFWASESTGIIRTA